VVSEDTVVVIEYPVELGSLPFVVGNGQLVGLRNRRYGRTVSGL
jgi:16S rRNA (guanine966-N2)-methyltransferase